MEGFSWTSPCGEKESDWEAVVWQCDSLAAFAAAQPCGLHSTQLGDGRLRCGRPAGTVADVGKRHERPAH